MRVLIIGGGIGGLNAALNFALRGHDVQLFEQAPHFDDIGAGIQLGPNAMHVMKFIGIDENLSKKANFPEFNTLRHYKSGKPYTRLQVKGYYENKYNAPYLHIHRADLIACLAQACENQGVHLHLNSRFKTAKTLKNNQGVSICVRQNKQSLTFEGDLLIGADGIHSEVKSAIFTTEFATEFGADSPNFTGQVAWRGLVPAEKLPQGLIAKESNIWIGKGKHFVAYYLRGGELVNFIAVEKQPAWTAESWNEKGDIQHIRALFEGWDDAVTQTLNAAESCYKWGLFDRQPLPRWSQGRMVLLGDACHPMLPFMAQGAAMALEDGYVLAEEMSDKGAVEDALKQYEKRRKPRTSMVQKMSRTNATRFHETRAWMLIGRWLYFKLFGRMNPLMKNSFNKIYSVNVTKSL